MKVFFEFNLPEDRDEWRIYDNAMNYYLALVQLERYIREQNKYAELTEEESLKMLEVKDKFYEALSENNIEL